MIYIKNIVSFVPETYIDNIANGEVFGHDRKFIESKIGAVKLPRLDKSQSVSEIVTMAVQKLIDSKSVNTNDIDALIVVTQNGDYGGLPHTAAIAHGMLGLKCDCSCFDVSLGCSGYVYGLSILKAHMVDMGYRNGVLVTADPYSKVIESDDRVTSLLFGDAATATLLSEEGVFDIGRPLLNTDGSGFDALIKDPYLKMNGRKVFNFAANNVPSQILDYTKQYCIELTDIDLLLLHQGSAAIVEVIRRKLGLVKDKVPLDINHTGNTVSSSIPMMLQKYIDELCYKQILISGFGVGLSWATNVLRRI